MTEKPKTGAYRKIAGGVGLLAILGMATVLFFVLRARPPLPPVDIIMVSGDRISGSVKKIDEGVALIRHPLILDEMTVPLEKIRMAYCDEIWSMRPAGKDWVVFPGGERLCGSLVSMSGETVTFESDSAGMLSIERHVVEALVLGVEPKAPSLDARMVELKPTNRNYGVPTMIAQLEQDGQTMYELELEPTKGQWSGQFSFLCESTRCPNGYDVRVTTSPERSLVELLRRPPVYEQLLGSSELEAGSASISLKVFHDSETGKTRIWANSERPLVYWTDPSPGRQGSYVRVTSKALRPGGESLPSSIKVTRMPRYRPEMTETDRKEDVFCHVGTATRLHGRVESIDDETIRLRVDHQESELARDDGVVILLSATKPSPLQGEPNTMELTLRNLDRLTLKVDRFNERVVSGWSPYAGRLRIERSLVSEIDFRMGRR